MTGLLTTAGLASLRAKMTAALPDACTISRNTPVSDGAGGWTDAWADVATTVCSIAPAGLQPAEKAIADRLTASVGYTITLPALTDVTVKDRIVVGARSFEVAGVMVRTQEIARRAVCSETT